MLELVPSGLQIDFIGKAKIWISISVVVILIGIASIVWRGGVNQGIDFSGGTLLQLRFGQPADLSLVREALGSPYARNRQHLWLTPLRMDQPHAAMWFPVARHRNCPVPCADS